MAAEDRVLEYAKTLAILVVPAQAAGIAGIGDRPGADFLKIPEPDLWALLVAAVDARDAIRNGQRAGFDTATQAWVTARTVLHDRILNALAGPVRSVPPLAALIRQAPLDDPDGMRLDAALGPLKVSIAASAVAADFPDPANPARVVLGPLPPDLFSGALNAGPAQGSGAMIVSADGLAGAFGLKLGVIDVSAIASLKLTPQQVPSFLAILGVAFTPGIQVGFGFSLNRIGGLVGIDRRVKIDALQRRLRSGTAGDILFSDNPAADAPRILGAVDEIFAVLDGASLFGPTMQIGWLKLGASSFFSLDVGVIVALPGPSSITVLGVAKAGIPPILKLRLDVLGILDFEHQLISIDASLVDSGVLGIFTIAGDAAFRLSYGSRPYTVLSIGGFYPGFNPEPAQIAPMQRFSMALDSPVPGVYMRAAGYMAVTTNTVQLGASFETGVKAGKVSASGFFDLDALIQFSPFHFHAEFAAGFRVVVFGATFGGIRFEGIIDGPGPIVLDGRLTIETFLFDISWHETFTFGQSGNDTRVPLRSLLDELAPELSRAENLRAQGGTDHLVRLAPRPTSGGRALVSPLGQMVWVQRRAPLNLAIDRLEGVPLGPPGTFQGVRVDTTVANKHAERTLFSPGSFVSLSKAEALNRPAFELLEAGLVLGNSGLEQSQSKAPRPDDYLIIRRVLDEFEQIKAVTARSIVSELIHQMNADRERPSAVTSTAAMVDVVTEEWRNENGRRHQSATEAHQAVRTGAAQVALPSMDFTRPVQMAGV